MPGCATPPVARLAELSSRGIDRNLAGFARSVMARILFGGQSFTGGVASSYIRKALRVGVWRNLRAEVRALLLAVSRWRGSIKSPLLRRILINIYIEIELYTTRGAALFYGLIIAVDRARDLLKNVVENLSRIIVMGIQYINLPPLFRIYG